MFAVPLSSSGSQQQGVEPSSSTSEWGNSPSMANMASSGSSSSNLSTTGGGWGSSSPFQQQNGQQAAAGSNGGSAGPSVNSTSTPVTDALNKQPSSSNSNSSSEWMVSPSASSMVWQTTAEPSGDNNNNNRNANPWSTPNPSSSSGFPTMSAKNNSLPNGNGNGNGNGSSNGNGGGGAQQYQGGNGASAQPQDKENVNPSTPVSAERTPLDNMIYREGWGQVEVKQEVPWMVPESPPPIHDDPSVWKPKANTGTEVWEKSTGHRTQPWQNQAPNTPRWISGEEEPSSLWSSAGGGPGGPLAAAPSNSASMMQSASALAAANGGGILSNGAMNASVLGSQGGRAPWTSSGSADSSGGNISPSNQWNSDVQDQEWSEWRDPSSRGSKSEKADDGTSHWGGMDRGADRQAQMREQQRNGMYNPPGSNSGAMKKAEERQRGWQESAYGNAAAMQAQAASEWSSANGDNEWTSGVNDKRSQQPQWPSTASSTLRDQHAQQRFSPPNNMAKHAREQIYQTKQYQGLLEMGFKREEIDVAMRNSMMNYEATLNELKRRRAQQQAQQMPMQQSSANSSSNAYGDSYKSGLAGLASSASASSQAAGQQSHLLQQQQQQQQSHQDMNKGQPNRAPAVPNIEALAHQLSVAARQGIISSRLLTQPLAPQTTYLLHKLMQSHRQMQNLTAQHEMLSKQHSPNPALQQRNMQQIVMAVNKIKADISTLQKQIESVQNEFMRSSSDPRFQSGPSLVDLTSSMPASGAFSDFQNAASPQAAAAAWQRNMPTEHAAHYGAAAGDASSWMNAGMGSQFMGGGGGGMAAAAAFGMPAVAAGMWNAPSNQWAAMGHSAAPAMGPYRQMAPSATSNVEDWTAHTMMKSPSTTTPSDHNVLSPTSRTMSQNNMSAYGSDDTDGSHHWGGNRQGDTSSYGGGSGSNTFGRFAWDTLPEFVPGKPWQGSQLLSADEDPHLTPGSVAKSPLSLNATSTATSAGASSSGNAGGNGNGGSGQRYGNDGSQ